MSFLTSLDFLSPHITLYQNGRIRHSSNCSGILTLTSYFICLLAVLYYFSEILLHKNPRMTFYKSFKNETGYFYLDLNGIFHYILLMNSQLNYLNYSSKYIRIKGMRNISYSLDNNSIEKNDHWIYDSCNTIIENYNLDINSYQNIEKGVCLKYFYNSTDRKYYKIGDLNYSSPFLLHGESRIDNCYYSLIVEKCTNDSIDNIIFGNERCANEEEIEIFFTNLLNIYLQIIDHNIFINDYKLPIQSFINPIRSEITKNNYKQHNINFSPIMVITYSNLILQSKKIEISFSIDDNIKNIKSNLENSNILCEFIFSMKNSFKIYERYYKNIYNILANMGGIYEAVISFATFINYSYHRYIVKYDSIILFGDKDGNLTNNKEILDRVKELKNMSNKSFSLPKPYFNSVLFANTNENLNTSVNKNFSILNKLVGKKVKKNNYIKKETLNIFKNVRISLFYFDDKYPFLYFLFRCKNKQVKNSLKAIENFRKKLLSEEHLYRNHLDLYFLEKFINVEKKGKININEIYRRL